MEHGGYVLPVLSVFCFPVFLTTIFISIFIKLHTSLIKMDWESKFNTWSKGPGASEQAKCENSIKAIRNAVSKSIKLASRDTSVFLQGSYRNRVNVRQDSDVDIGVLCTDTYYYEIPTDTTLDDFNIKPATYHLSEYKKDLEDALVKYFDRKSVKRGNIAFNLKENTYRVDADITPFFVFKWFQRKGSSDIVSGVETYSDDNKQIQ